MVKKALKISAMALAGGLIVVGSIYASKPKEVSAGETYNTDTVEITSALNKYVVSLAAAPTSETVDGVAEDTASPDTQASNVMYPDFQGKLIAAVDDSINIRSEATQDSERIGKFPGGAIGTVIEKGAEWTKMQSGSVTGYVKNEYVLFDDEAGAYAVDHAAKYATVVEGPLRLRSEQSTDSECILALPQTGKYKVVEEGAEWTKITADNEVEGYVASQYIAITYEYEYAMSAAEEENMLAEQERERQAAAAQNNTANNTATTTGNQNTTGNQGTNSTNNTGTKYTTSARSPEAIAQYVATLSASDAQKAIVADALQYEGGRYVAGGANLATGVDCSGFTMAIYSHFGVSLSHSSDAQSRQGELVDLNSLQPGDLIYYYSRSNPSVVGHVSIYIGNNQVIHASSPEAGICIYNTNYRQAAFARRHVH